MADSAWKHAAGFLSTQLFFILLIALMNIKKPSNMYFCVNYG